MSDEPQVLILARAVERLNAAQLRSLTKLIQAATARQLEGVQGSLSATYQRMSEYWRWSEDISPSYGLHFGRIKELLDLVETRLELLAEQQRTAEAIPRAPDYAERLRELLCENAGQRNIYMESCDEVTDYLIRAVIENRRDLVMEVLAGLGAWHTSQDASFHKINTIMKAANFALERMPLDHQSSADELSADEQAVLANIWTANHTQTPGHSSCSFIALHSAGRWSTQRVWEICVQLLGKGFLQAPKHPDRYIMVNWTTNDQGAQAAAELSAASAH